MNLSKAQCAALGFRPSKNKEKLRVGVVSITNTNDNIRVYLANALMSMLYKLSSDPRGLMGATDPMTAKPSSVLHVASDDDKVTISVVHGDSGLNTRRAYDLAVALFTERLGITGKKVSIKKLANKLEPYTAHLNGYEVVTEEDDDDDDTDLPPWDTGEYEWKSKVADFKPETGPAVATVSGFDEMAAFLGK